MEADRGQIERPETAPVVREAVDLHTPHLSPEPLVHTHTRSMFGAPYTVA
jgi:hypothetical protein